MFVKIRKRDGREVPFNAEKIAETILKTLATVAKALAPIEGRVICFTGISSVQMINA